MKLDVQVWIDVNHLFMEETWAKIVKCLKLDVRLLHLQIGIITCQKEELLKFHPRLKMNAHIWTSTKRHNQSLTNAKLSQMLINASQLELLLIFNDLAKEVSAQMEEQQPIKELDSTSTHALINAQLQE